MPANGNFSNFERTNFANDSSWSSNSETLGDIKKSANPISRQWSAIERTLYEEEGEQIEDPELLRECKLWRESFPHLRVRGKKIWDVEENIVAKNVQPVQSQINFKKIHEKRENIKNRVVGEIVQRLITRFNENKLPNISRIHDGDSRNRKSGIEITEIDDGIDLEPLSSNVPMHLPEKSVLSSKGSPLDEKKQNREILLPSSERESYFERGKKEKIVGEQNDGTVEKLEKRIYEIFDTWDGEDDKLDKGNQLIKPEVRKTVKAVGSLSKNFDIKLPSGEKIGLTNSGKSSRRRHKSSYPSESLSSHVKPVEIANKIDRKYEDLLNKIMERNCGVTTEPRKQTCQKQRSTARHQDREPLTYLESLEKIRINSGFEEYYKKSYHALPKITTIKTHNEWLERSEIMSSTTSRYEGPYFKKSSKVTNSTRLIKHETDEQFIRNLKKEMNSGLKKPPMKSGVLEEIRVSRPMPFLPPGQNTKRNIKSSSCGDLPNKNKKNVRQSKNGPDSSKKNENQRAKTKFTTVNTKRSRRIENPSGTLPPIETGIICTELVGRPKIGSKTQPKRR